MRRVAVGLAVAAAALAAILLSRPRQNQIAQRPAHELRRDARREAAVARHLKAVLQEVPEWSAEREKAAFILGSLGQTDALLAALAAARDPKWIRVLLLALGTDRDLTTDNLFALPPDGPWVVETPGGLRVRIYAFLNDDERAAVSRFLQHESADLRWVAARVLRHSLEATDARNAFIDLILDPNADVQEEIADALAPHAPRDERILPQLLDLSLRSDRVRFKISDSLRDLPLTPAQQQWFASTLVQAADPALRLWAFETLSFHPPDGFESTAANLLLSDPSSKLRERAAACVTNPATLAQGLRDSEWNVRLACVQAITDPAALAAVLDDPDERVREAARTKAQRP
ncbi:MAG: HEAT repeat domain-containing protein [Planctomycetes bacterium]|nr:HEAT repeat domain-containing protein [Planctomycetota bacterium]